jgi:hypothetical protein
MRLAARTLETNKENAANMPRPVLKKAARKAPNTVAHAIRLPMPSANTCARVQGLVFTV